MESVASYRVGSPIAYRRREHVFFSGTAVAMALVVLTGFARSFFFAFMWREHDPDASTEPIYYIHGAFAASWMAVAVVQPLLIRTRHIQWHRRLGWMGAAIALIATLTGVLVALLSAARKAGATPPPTPLNFVGVIASGILIFGLLVCLGVFHRQNGSTHKRLMYLASVNLLQAAVVRIPWSSVHFAGP